MSASNVLDAFGLPQSTRLARRIPKTLLLEQGASTAADRRSIRDGIEQLTWFASLKPTTVGVPAFRDATREYLEIAVLALVLRDESKSARIIELLHRAIPYPVVLCTECDGAVRIALAHKRRSQGQGGDVVLEESCRTPPLQISALGQQDKAFVASLALASLPRTNLFALYQAWFDRVVALEAAQITGQFIVPQDPSRAAVRLAALTEYARLERTLAALRAGARRERQLNRLVDINLAVKQLETELTEAVKAL